VRQDEEVRSAVDSLVEGAERTLGPWASVSTGAPGARGATHAAGREAGMASVAHSTAKLPCLIIAVSRRSTTAGRHRRAPAG
jgi:lipid-binding SYLF domain-containing protein